MLFLDYYLTTVDYTQLPFCGITPYGDSELNWYEYKNLIRRSEYWATVERKYVTIKYDQTTVENLSSWLDS